MALITLLNAQLAFGHVALAGPRRFFALEDLDALQSEIEAYDAWNWEQRVEETLQRLHLDPEAVVGTLSGGTKKRVAWHRRWWHALMCCCWTSPPTTWIWIPSSGWKTCCWTSGQRRDHHPRPRFLDRVATRIVELDRGQLRSYPGNFAQYQMQKEEQLAQEAVINAKADKLLAQEEVWIRKGVEARRTRSQSRISRLEQLRASDAEARRESWAASAWTSPPARATATRARSWPN
jgi:ATP-binding cassette subfamily F protein uup